ncbi:helix-turn-helix transcriptional regulator [Nocardia terpenica]|uniref:Transcriptional regulator n=1 Tax=Nocardia terpenica TaxID=455432 RepID=A0A164H071_9NOCA|nr:helix-turn-helix transcriptional regulator [Nocardia terpenica]KZM68092.1 transcriptional regulator [Nocardia terpenica]NQE89054.1 helix-turn-helix transcriptional regulator [Nocardia terpenica]
MNWKEDPIRVGSTIRSLREAYGWTRLGLAEAVGLSRSHLSNIEDGRKVCTPQVARKVADALGVPLAAITTARTSDEIAGLPTESLAR